MIEYPSIISSAKAPRKHCIAFDKLDGSNFRAKWTKKQGFSVFGTRTQLIDESTEFWSQMISAFKKGPAAALDDKFKKDKEFRDEREFIVFGEFLGKSSFAGRHKEDEQKEIIVFDVLRGHKNRRFVPPADFIKEFQTIIKIPDVIYVGNLNEPFIKNVRENTFNLNEGVICKGTQPSGAYAGHVWSCKIKTQEYFEKLKAFFGVEWERYWE